MAKITKFLGLIAIILCAIPIIDGYNILMVLPFLGPSHFLMFKVFIKEMVDRGHHVTAITAFQYKDKLENYIEIYIDEVWKLDEDFSPEALFKKQFDDSFQMLCQYWKMGIDSTEHALNNAPIKNFVLNDKSQFDLILAEQFFQESLLMFSHKYQAPIVTICTYGYSDFLDRIMGAMTPYSFVPHMILFDYDDKMSFRQRFHNLMFSMTDVLIRKFYYLPKMNKMAKKHFGHLDGPLPKVEDLEKSISAVLINSHWSLTKSRPLMPGMINIAGAHIKPTKPLPNDIQEFLDGAEHGAIYFSLGAFMQSSKMPKDTVANILKVFRSIKQRILWKWENENIPNLPKNVMIKKWMPQSDILAHSNIVLFISHGGLFGTIEGSFYGVPMLFIPFFGDQYRNAAIAQSSGYALRLLFPDINERTLRAKIMELTYHKKYYNRAKEVSKLLNDNPIKPMDEAMYWIEYVIRNKGAKHLKSAAIDLPWYQYLMLDIFGLLFATIAISSVTIRYVFKHWICRSKQHIDQTRKNE